MMMKQNSPSALSLISGDPAFRLADAVEAPPPAEHCEAVKRVIEVMHERLDVPLSLHDMSRIAYISPYHFNRVFHQVTGIPPCQFLYALRLETAKRLLLTTDISVTDVCFEVGYNSLGTFIRRFTGLVGTSPGRFRSLGHSAPAVSFAPPPSPAPGAPGLFPGSGWTGRVTAPEGFMGAIFIGIFAAAIPQGEPIAGTVITQPGPYRIAAVPDGRYYILATGLSWSADPKEYFLYETSLRGGQPIQVHHGEVKGAADLALRPPTPFDPPILLTLPLLLTESMTGASVA